MVYCQKGDMNGAFAKALMWYAFEGFGEVEE